MAGDAGALCGICGSALTRPWLASAADYVTGDRFDVRRCPRCDIGVTSPQPASMERYYEVRYRRYSPSTAGLLHRFYRWRARRWARDLGAPGLALEIGCGEGWMLAALRQRGWRVIGSERTSEASREAAARHGISMFAGSIAAVRPERRFDLVILFHVLEHLSAPLEVLSACERVLKPDGMLIVAVPNSRSWQARLFGTAWFHLDVPRHLYHYSPASLRHALEAAGLRSEATSFVSFEHDPYGWVQSVLNRIGFRQNLLTRMLMRSAHEPSSVASVAAMSAVAILIAPASVLASIASWIGSAGAVMEMRARKPAVTGPRHA